MKEWNAHTVTSASNFSRRFGAACVLALAVAAVSPAAAQEAGGVVPSLYGVSEIKVEQARLSDAPLTGACGLSSGEISHIALKALKNDGLPAFSVVNAPAPKAGAFRIDLLPTVSTIQVTESSCTSWVSLSAQSRENVILPPIKAPRTAVLSYWEAGLLVHSGKNGHAQALINAVDKLAVQFSRQYRMDQPPDLSSTGQGPATTAVPAKTP